MSDRAGIGAGGAADEGARRTRALLTPEGVDLRVRLAEAGGRAGAFLLDLAIMIGTLIAMTIVLALAARGAEGTEGTGEAEGELFSVLWLLGFFVLRLFYFTLWELTPRAATHGKRATGLRVASRDGRPLRPEAVIARNAMREVEVFLPLSFLFSGGAAGAEGWVILLGLAWSLIFLLFPLFNRNRLRAGDLIGGTWVIEAPKRQLLGDLAQGAAPHAHAFTDAETGLYGIKELHVLEDVLRAKDAQAMAAVAERIRAKIGRAARPGESDLAFLEAYYAALRKRLEGGLLFGVRKADKNADAAPR